MNLKGNSRIPFIFGLTFFYTVVSIVGFTTQIASADFCRFQSIPLGIEQLQLSSGIDLGEGTSPVVLASGTSTCAGQTQNSYLISSGHVETVVRSTLATNQYAFAFNGDHALLGYQLNYPFVLDGKEFIPLMGMRTVYKIGYDKARTVIGSMNKNFPNFFGPAAALTRKGADGKFSVTEILPSFVGYSEARAINARGDIAGYRMSSAGSPNVFVRFSDGSVVDYTNGAFSWVSPTAINSVGQVVGIATIGRKDTAYVWTQKGAVEIASTLALDDTVTVNDINDSGVVVGSFNRRAFIFDGVTKTDITSKLCFNPLFPSGGVIQSASAINNAGYIVGTLQYLDGSTPHSRAVLLKPVVNGVTSTPTPLPSPTSCL